MLYVDQLCLAEAREQWQAVVNMALLYTQHTFIYSYRGITDGSQREWHTIVFLPRVM